MSFLVFSNIVSYITLALIPLVLAIGYSAYKTGRHPRPLALVTIVAISLILVLLDCLYPIATQHGMYDDTEPFQNVISSIMNTPTSQDASLEERNTIIVLYRFGCEDCESVYHELRDTLSLSAKEVNVKWVSSRSEDGKAIVSSLGIDAVPSLVFVDNDGTVYKEPVSKKTRQRIELDVDNVEKILNRTMTM